MIKSLKEYTKVAFYLLEAKFSIWSLYYKVFLLSDGNIDCEISGLGISGTR